MRNIDQNEMKLIKMKYETQCTYILFQSGREGALDYKLKWNPKLYIICQKPRVFILNEIGWFINRSVITF